MTEPIMDFFDDPAIFGEGLDSLVQDDPEFPPGTVSLEDELHLGPSFEEAGSTSALQHGIPYSHPMGNFDTMKEQTSIPQSFSGPEGGNSDGRAFLPQQQQFQGHNMNQVPQTNGLFLNNSPMWGNHDQKIINYHQHHQQHQHPQLKQFQQQQFQQHQGQHQQYGQQHLQQRQHGLDQHPMSNQQQIPHQQIACQGLHHLGKTYQEHAGFYYQGNVSQIHSQQGHHNLPYREGSSFHHAVAQSSHSQSKPFLEASMMPVSSQQHSGFPMAQGVQSFTASPRLDDNGLGFPVQSSPATHSFSSGSVSHASSYPTAHYSLACQPPSVVTQSYSSAPVSLTTSSTAIPSSAPNLLDSGCSFLSSGMEHQQQVQLAGSTSQQCLFRGMQSSKSNRDPFISAELFSEGPNSFSADHSFPLTGRKNCNVAVPSSTRQSGSNSNGFQVEEALLGEQHGGRLEDLGEAPDLLEDELLPHLEALDQEETSNHSWVNAGLGDEQQEEDRVEVKGEVDGHDVPIGHNSQ
ncbi:putative chromodomain-helicase-DNA-binding protein 9, partial [Triplophysa rosa]